MTLIHPHQPLQPFQRDAVNKLLKYNYARIEMFLGTGFRDVVATAMLESGPAKWVIIAPKALHEDWRRSLTRAKQLVPAFTANTVLTSYMSIRHQYYRGYLTSNTDAFDAWQAKRFVLELPVNAFQTIRALRFLTQNATHIWIRPSLGDHTRGLYLIRKLGLFILHPNNLE